MKLKNYFVLSKTKLFFSAAISLAYSMVSILGPMIHAQDIAFGKIQLLQFIACLVGCFIVNLFIFAIVPQLPIWKKKGRLSRFIAGLSDRKLLLFTWLFIFLLWIPAYLVMYPGVLSYDILTQVMSAMEGITQNHHPVLHTWLIRVFLQLGNSLGLGYEFGIGLLSLIQMILLSYALARMVCLLKRKGVPGIIVIVTALLSAIWYMNACLSVSIVKDCPYAVFFVLFACHFVEIVTNAKEYCAQKRNLFILPIVGFLMCAFRNNGIYIYVFCFAGLVIWRISQIKKAKAYVPLIIAVLLPVFMYKIYAGPVFEALDIQPGQKREALCIPIQQLQRVAVLKRGDLTAEQLEVMDYYIDNLHWMAEPVVAYDPFFADPAKSCFYSDHYTEDPIAFWKFYLEIGLQYPGEYVKAFLANTLGFWYPGYYDFSYVMYENYSPTAFVIPLERKSILNWEPLKDYYKSVCSAEFWRETPVIRLFFSQGFTIWFLVYGIALAWEKKDFFVKRVLLFLPLVGQYGIMLLSPMSSFRYAWPFYLILPIAFIAVLGGPTHNEEEKEEV